MKLNVFVHGKPVATLSSADGLEHSLTYRHDATADDFVSLLMPVQPRSWVWPGGLHPFFQVSLPEGFLLSILKQEVGPHLGARPLDLLAIVGRNTIGRVQVAAGETLSLASASLELEQLLHGDSSAEVFMRLMREFASSGVSGVFPKFLTPETKALFRKGAVATERHIVKGSSAQMPFVALNEHLCMEVARRTGFAAPSTKVSDDGQVLVVERFDIDPATDQRLGFEDCCSLLGLTPDDKYQSSWERVARLVTEWVPGPMLRQSQEQLAVTLLLTYALGNADCHTKNLGLLYSTMNDVRVAPIYDMLTVRAYDHYADNPPGMFINGSKTWTPRKALWRYLQQHLGLEPARQRELVDIVCDATAGVFPELLHHVKHTAGFKTTGSRMIWEWNEGMKRFSDRVSVVVADFVNNAVDAGVGRPEPALKFDQAVRIGESPLLAPRGRRRKPPPAP
jgi:serine/threonine-protein kinase HipA